MYYITITITTTKHNLKKLDFIRDQQSLFYNYFVFIER